MREPFSRNAPPQPGLGGALKHLPPSLTHLELSDVQVSTYELDECILAHLTKFSLHNCRGSPIDLATKACQASPHLETLVTSWKFGRRPLAKSEAQAQILFRKG